MNPSSSNFIQTHGRSPSTTAPPTAQDHLPSLADEMAEAWNESSPVATRRLEQALLRLDQAVTRRQLRTSTVSTPSVNPIASPSRPAPSGPRIGQRSLPTSGVELDESVAANTSMWLETAEESRLRVDPPQRAALPAAARPVLRPASPTFAPPPGRVLTSASTASASSPTESLSPDAFSPVLAGLFASPIDVSFTAGEVGVSARVPLAVETDAIEAAPGIAPEIASAPASTFVAAWQVEAFPLPTAVEDLFLQQDVSDSLAERLSEAQRDGLRTIAVTSVHHGEGRSTVALGLALSVATSGLTIALVDADADGATLAGDLRLELDNGWVDALRTSMPLEEIAVHSASDRVTLFPLIARANDRAASPAELRQLLHRLQTSFDLILVDCPASDTATATLCDTALIVRDAQATPPLDVEQLALALRRHGSKGIGIVENFCQ